jgi:hypothetical protein
METEIKSADEQKLSSAIRKLKITVVILPILLIYGMWQTRGGPLAPRLVGAGVNLFFTFWLISIIRKGKARLAAAHVRNTGQKN